MGKLFIGTSGWQYYQDLEFYSRNFKTVEVNYSFYRLPQVSSFQKWTLETPEDFIFALKLSRFITHIKRLRESATENTRPTSALKAERQS